jgi:hypothetical protein
MSTDGINHEDGQDWPMDRHNAVEILGVRLAQLRRNSAPGTEDLVSISLRFREWELLHECAKNGVNKGQGRKRPAATRGDKLRKGAIICFARDRKIKLVEAGLKATGSNSAEDQAAEEARQLGNDRYGLNLSVNTIKRLMQSKN